MSTSAAGVSSAGSAAGMILYSGRAARSCGSSNVAALTGPLIAAAANKPSAIPNNPSRVLIFNSDILSGMVRFSGPCVGVSSDDPGLLFAEAIQEAIRTHQQAVAGDGR